MIIKRVLRTNTAQWIVSGFIASYVALVNRTNRIDRPPLPIPEPYIMAAWHGRLISLPMLRNGKKPLIALISGHRDGMMLSKAASLFGIKTASGSSSRGGMRAVRELIRSARDGHCLFMTPDGPRGPRMHCSEGIVDLARLTGLPIIPAAMSADRGVILNSWDRMLLPGFFTRVIIRWGEPLVISADDDKAAMLAKLDAALTKVQNEADIAAGRPLVARA